MYNRAVVEACNCVTTGSDSSAEADECSGTVVDMHNGTAVYSDNGAIMGMHNDGNIQA
jgi:hypothetical protein